MRLFYAESLQTVNGSDRLMGHTYEAIDQKEAEAIAKTNGWEYSGEAELELEQECPDEAIAIIELRLEKPVVH